MSELQPLDQKAGTAVNIPAWAKIIAYDGAVFPTASRDTSYGVNSFGARAQIDF